MPHVTAVHGKSAEVVVQDGFAARHTLEHADGYEKLAKRVRAAGLIIDTTPQAELLVAFIGKPASESIQFQWGDFDMKAHCTEGQAPAEVTPFFDQLVSILESQGWSSTIGEGVVALNFT